MVGSCEVKYMTFPKIECCASNYSYNQPVSLGCTPVPPATVTQAPKRKKKMSYDDDFCDECDGRAIPVETKQRKYLLTRLYELNQDKEYAARKTFNIDDDPAPEGGDQLVERIKSGKFILNQELIDATNKEGRFFSMPCLYGIEWRDPAKPSDEAGFKAFRDKLNKLYTDTADTINIASPADGLVALKAFEAATVN